MSPLQVTALQLQALARREHAAQSLARLAVTPAGARYRHNGSSERMHNRLIKSAKRNLRKARRLERILAGEVVA